LNNHSRVEGTERERDQAQNAMLIRLEPVEPLLDELGAIEGA
jgi:hypothetical protein